MDQARYSPVLGKSIDPTREKGASVDQIGSKVNGNLDGFHNPDCNPASHPSGPRAV